MSIEVLSPELISRIAAGEVVERPASVVKELVENALDAQANQVTVEVRGGGVGLIRVVDNGCGISTDEVELAFRRYATSKIHSLLELERISSLGFRGEALPAIAAVAQVELFTQAPGEAVGTFLSLNDGTIIEKGSRGRPPGTTVSVSHLFRSFPARLKFLRSAATENSHIVQVVTRYALAFPHVRFALYIEGRPTLRTSGDGELKDTALEVYGLDIAQQLNAVATEEGGVQVQGLISPSALTWSHRNYLSFFVNRRWIQSPRLAWAVEQAYGSLPQGQHPLAILHLFMPAEEVDVNVHPTKAEVRFRAEFQVQKVVGQAVSRVLGRIPSPATPSEPMAEAMALPASFPLLRVLGQVANSYIIAEGPDGLYLVDQHAAHERVLYQTILSQWQTRKVEMQGLLDPLTLEVSPKEEAALKAKLEDLANYGFALESFGPRSYLVRRIPALLQGKDVLAALQEIVAGLAAGGAAGGWWEEIAISLACHGAVKAGQPLSPEEMRELLRQLEHTPSPRTCPHGRPTTLHLSSSLLEKEFGRR